VRPGVEVVEVFDQRGDFVATIVEDQAGDELRIVSLHVRDYRGHELGDGLHAVRVRLNEDRRPKGLGRPPLVWWLTTDDREAIGVLPPAFPAYLRDQYASRPAGGRLTGYGTAEIQTGLPETPFSRLLKAKAGGIVVHAHDAHLLRDLPGTVTDLALGRVLP
jgi:hypothetical protein